MVIATNDSCNTLVSLDNDHKELASNANLQTPEREYVNTRVHLPADEFCLDDDGDETIYLPLNTRVDHYLKTVPQLMDTCDELLANPPRVFYKDSTERVVYVAQGEVGHSLTSQCDVLVSDKATTCHILAIRSELEGNLPLTSLTHLDGTSYESCIRKMVAEHIVHHQANQWWEEEKKSDDVSLKEKIDLQVHIVGGFEDADSTSLELSSWLMNLLAQIAAEEQDAMKMTLKTCAITSMNDNGYSCPIGRGLGIDVRSGDVFLAKVEEEVAGPAVQLRSVRLWAGPESRELSLVHSSRFNGMAVLPFSFKPFAQVNQLLRLPDHLLLHYTSTSPDVEESDFCSSVRSTLCYLRDAKCEEVFGADIDKPLVFHRDGKSNSWKRAD